MPYKKLNGDYASVANGQTIWIADAHRGDGWIEKTPTTTSVLTD